MRHVWIYVVAFHHYQHYINPLWLKIEDKYNIKFSLYTRIYIWNLYLYILHICIMIKNKLSILFSTFSDKNLLTIIFILHICRMNFILSSLHNWIYPEVHRNLYTYEFNVMRGISTGRPWAHRFGKSVEIQWEINASDWVTFRTSPNLIAPTDNKNS